MLKSLKCKTEDAKAEGHREHLEGTIAKCFDAKIRTELWNIPRISLISILFAIYCTSWVKLMKTPYKWPTNI